MFAIEQVLSATALDCPGSHVCGVAIGRLQLELLPSTEKKIKASDREPREPGAEITPLREPMGELLRKVRSPGAAGSSSPQVWRAKTLQVHPQSDHHTEH